MADCGLRVDDCDMISHTLLHVIVSLTFISLLFARPSFSLEH